MVENYLLQKKLDLQLSLDQYPMVAMALEYKRNRAELVIKKFV